MIFDAGMLSAANEFVAFLNGTDKIPTHEKFEFLDLGTVYNDGEEWVLEVEHEHLQYEAGNLPHAARIITFTKYYKGDKPYEYVAVKIEDHTGTLWCVSGRTLSLSPSELVEFVNKVDDIKPVVTVLAWDE